MLCTDPMPCSHDSALEKREGGFHAVRVDVAIHVHTITVQMFLCLSLRIPARSRANVACDLGRFAIHTTRKRRLGIPGVKPFVVQNLGKYERQAWQVAEFATSRVGADAHVRPAERSSAATVRGENPSQGQVALPADKGSFDSRNGFASESVSSAQDDRVKKDALREQRGREG